MIDAGVSGNQGVTHGTLEKELQTSLVDGKLPCAVAFAIAARLKTGRKQVGDEANRLGLRVVDCQLGCFTVRKATHQDIIALKVEESVATKLREASPGGMLPCASAFSIAAKLKLTPKSVGDAATALKIRIVRCQLGCF